MTDLANQLGQAATLMVTGMVVVFVFLTLVIYFVRLMSFVVTKSNGASCLPIETKSSATASQVPEEVVVAISAAIAQHRASTVKS